MPECRHGNKLCKGGWVNLRTNDNTKNPKILLIYYLLITPPCIAAITKVHISYLCRNTFRPENDILDFGESLALNP